MGKRTGKPRGRPKGTKNPATLSKEQGREALRQIVMREMEAMTAAQVANAKGLSYLVAREKGTGKFTRLTPEQIERILESGEQADEFSMIEVWGKDPSTPAYTDLMNRALDKPKEQAQELQVTGSLELVERLQAARKRLEKR